MPQRTAEFTACPGRPGWGGQDTHALSPDRPAVRRLRLGVPGGGHLSALAWGEGAAEVVFLHEAGRSAREWDQVARCLSSPAVAIDLPGHGHSSWRRDGLYQPRRIAAAVAEGILSLAPGRRLVVGSGLGGLTALALATGPRPPLLPRLVLIDTLPGLVSYVAHEPRTGPERFGSRNAAMRFLAAVYPKWPTAVIRHEVDHELQREADGSWGWRHHPGNQADPTGSQFDDLSLWQELAALESPVWVVRGDLSARVNADIAGQLERRAPGVQLMTITGGADVVAGKPAELADRLNQMLAI
jgi:pimeloyl-ACP methyl ester carboxylesterase